MKANKIANRKLQESGIQMGSFLLVGLLCGIAVFCALFFAAAILLCKVDLPVNLLVPMTSVIACAAVLSAAYATASMAGKRGLLYGLLMGGLLFLLLWLAAALQGADILTQLAGLKAALMVLSGAVGGFLGTLSSERRHKRRVRGG